MKNFIGQRITELRQYKGVSARDMSLSLGQTHSYINQIENGRTMPSMEMFFYICEYFNITPGEFFTQTSANPLTLREIIDDLKTLDSEELETIKKLLSYIKK